VRQPVQGAASFLSGVLVSSPSDKLDLDVSRRDALKTLAAGLGAVAVVPLMPAEAAESVRQAIAARKAGAPLAFFTPAQHRTVDVLAEQIIPADDRSPGAHDAGVADYLDYVLSRSPAGAQQVWTDGLAALDQASRAQAGRPFASATPAQQVAVLTEAAKNEFSPSTPLEHFFTEAKAQTIFAYYTTDIGIHQELRYKGNQYLAEFVGCDHPEHME
jgi:gluconate 2-dehydrogenase gamma chain